MAEKTAPWHPGEPYLIRIACFVKPLDKPLQGSVKVWGSVSRAWPAPTGCFRGHGLLLSLLS